MKVRLIRKLAERVDDVSLVDRRVGDEFDLPDAEARLLIAEGWAVPVPPPSSSSGGTRSSSH